ncbi:PIG-L deacetylase family protein [Deinococcus pimensis]|uniref:PIG-L deacetylase family protein n=1 Tax=Deinococcus pimensis TaxID=309888 RepID=UPI0004802D76|nr:PIG-L deacetylase family protein [Deinococcus pimensis]
MPIDPPSLLAVFAHPDDEAFSSGGTLARYAERGVKVTLACATRGEAGKITDPTLTVEDLGRHREEELREACRALGIPDPVFLGYHDSGRQERTRHDDPRALLNVEPLDVETRLLDVIERARPQVMLTFDPHGGYGHVDHLVVHRAATAAFYSGTARYPGLRRLFYTAMPVELTRRFVESGMPMDYEPERYGVTPDTIAVAMDVEAYGERKMAALRAHGSQTGPNSRMNQLPEEQREAMRRSIVAKENFALAGTRGPIPQWPLRGFFDGLDGYEHVED